MNKKIRNIVMLFALGLILAIGFVVVALTSAKPLVEVDTMGIGIFAGLFVGVIAIAITKLVVYEKNKKEIVIQEHQLDERQLNAQRKCANITLLVVVPALMLIGALSCFYDFSFIPLHKLLFLIGCGSICMYISLCTFMDAYALKYDKKLFVIDLLCLILIYAALLIDVINGAINGFDSNLPQFIIETAFLTLMLVPYVIKYLIDKKQATKEKDELVELKKELNEKRNN